MTAGQAGTMSKLARFYRHSEGARGFALMSPTMLVMLAALAAPLALLALYSFWSQNGYALDTHFSLAQYRASLGRAGYRALFLRSLEISSLVTAITVLLAYPMAYFVAFRVEKSKFVWLVLLTIPFWTSYLLRVFAWKVILGYNGVVNSGLMSLGLIHQPLEFLLYNPTAVVVALAHAWAPFAILPIYVSLEKIDRSLLEAAADLGDGTVRRFFRVTLPLSMPGVIAAAVVIFVPTTGDYVTPSLVGGVQGYMFGQRIADKFVGQAFDWQGGAVLALFLMAVVLVLTAATSKFLRAGGGAV